MTGEPGDLVGIPFPYSDLETRKGCPLLMMIGLKHRYRLSEMELKVVVHEAEEGGYWAEVPGIPGCATQGETLDELRNNIQEALEGCLSLSTGIMEDPS